MTAGFPAPQIRYRFLRSRPPRRRPRFPALDLLLSPQISPSRYPLPLWLFSCDSRCGGYVFRSGGRPGACVRRIPSMRRCSAGCIRRSRIKKDGRRLCVRLCPGGLSAKKADALKIRPLLLPVHRGEGWGCFSAHHPSGIFCQSNPESGEKLSVGLLTDVSRRAKPAFAYPPPSQPGHYSPPVTCFRRKRIHFTITAIDLHVAAAFAAAPAAKHVQELHLIPLFSGTRMRVRAGDGPGRAFATKAGYHIQFAVSKSRPAGSSACRL